MIHNQVEDQMSLITQMYPGVYAQVAQHQANTGNNNNNKPVQPGNNKPAARRRRRKRSAKSGDQVGSGLGKRKLSVGQVSSLERSFEDEHKLESERKDRLAKELGLDPRQVAVWFQNRRARWKNKKLEEEHSSLKALYDNAVIEKSHLHSQVMRLTEQLNEADREIQRLAERVEIGSSNSPTSSLSVEAAAEPSFFGDFVAAQEYDNDPAAGLYVGPDGDYLPNMEWMMGGLYM